jgi:hypothetical protein
MQGDPVQQRPELPAVPGREDRRLQLDPTIASAHVGQAEVGAARADLHRPDHGPVHGHRHWSAISPQPHLERARTRGDVAEEDHGLVGRPSLRPLARRDLALLQPAREGLLAATAHVRGGERCEAIDDRRGKQGDECRTGHGRRPRSGDGHERRQSKPNTL